MAELKHDVQTALDENRMLVLGCQVLLGLEFRSVFEDGFEKLPPYCQHLKLAGLVLMLLALALLLTPPSFHRLVEEGEDTRGFLRMVSRLAMPAPFPFVCALAIDLYVAGLKVVGPRAAVALGVGGALFGLALLYGLETIQYLRRVPRARGEIEAMKKEHEEQEKQKTELKDKIRHVLTEARVLLPGAQALIGFQFATMLMTGFDKLPESSKRVHLVSLTLIAVSVVLLMAPAAYHRIVEFGRNTEHMHKIASGMVLAAMVMLGPGLAGEFFVVVRKVTGSVKGAALGAGAMLIVTYGLWFGLTLVARARRKARGHERPAGRRPVSVGA